MAARIILDPQVGRVAIAGARLDLQVGLLWHHLERGVPFETSRSKPGSVQREKVTRLAAQRLSGDLQQAVLAAVSSVEAAQSQRNEVIHQDWVLRGREATRGHRDRRCRRRGPGRLPGELAAGGQRVEQLAAGAGSQYRRGASPSLGAAAGRRTGAGGGDRESVRAGVRGGQLPGDRQTAGLDLPDLSGPSLRLLRVTRRAVWCYARRSVATTGRCRRGR